MVTRWPASPRSRGWTRKEVEGGGRRGASPRSRGWTPDSLTPPATPGGFPALAGMDLLAAEPRRARHGLPRARGDGPSVGTRRRSTTLASPRSRGWTRLPRRGRSDRDGFPALAGMDLLLHLHDCPAYRLPRARGDGPAAKTALSCVETASPRSRGWTLLERVRTRLVEGFPALAGMDRRGRRYSPPPRRLPRARGDGPFASPPSRSGHRASPRSRGWTPQSGPALPRRIGFPALAGMDLPRLYCAVMRYRLPRARGDGPNRRLVVTMPLPASPRSRGWTRHALGGGRRREGFPALAGMDRARWRRSASSSRLPRARGDGPVVLRLRGPVTPASPRSRGWTLVRVVVRRPPPGFPALAGMDLGRRCA